MLNTSVGIDLNTTPLLPTNDTLANVNDAKVAELNKTRLENKKLKEMLTQNKKLKEMLTLVWDNFLENHVNMSDFMRSNPSKRKLKERDECNTSESMECHHPGSSKRPHDCTPRVYSQADLSDKSMVVKDPFKWRKYGQKVLKNNPYGRSYYKCSFAPSCPAKKKVEKSADDPNLLVTTYEGEHNHEKRMENEHENLTSNKSFNSKYDQVLVEKVADSLRRNPDFITELVEAISSKISKQNFILS